MGAKRQLGAQLGWRRRVGWLLAKAAIKGTREGQGAGKREGRSIGHDSIPIFLDMCRICAWAVPCVCVCLEGSVPEGTI